MSQALYRKYRSRSFAELAGQEHITATLEAAVRRGKVSHAYLFTGPRGVGKTSIARIMAHAINDLPYSDKPHLDIIEIDAASNRRIEDVRDLREKVHIAPVSAAYKVYIIDEVHMLTTESFNALLKTLEEPPSHVVFILATTELHKLPATITSRTQRFAFVPPPNALLFSHIKEIAQKEKILISTQAIELLTEHADSSFRDAISLLDQVSSLGREDTEISEQAVAQLLGIAPMAELDKLLSATLAHKPATVVDIVQAFEKTGVTAASVANGLIRAAFKKAATDSNAVRLLDGLTSVARNPYPAAKLLAVLLTVAHQTTTPPQGSTPMKQRHIALQATSVEITAAPRKTVAAKDTAAIPSQSNAASKQKNPSADDTDQIPFDLRTVIECWGDIIASLKIHSAPLSGALKNAEVRIGTDNSLLLAFKTAFHSRKIDDIKHKQAFVIALQKVTRMSNVTVTTIVDASAAPTPLNMRPATPAASTPATTDVMGVMGGGEVVQYTE